MFDTKKKKLDINNFTPSILYFLYWLWVFHDTRAHAKTSFIATDAVRVLMSWFSPGEGTWREKESLADINEDHDSVHNCVLRNSAARTDKKTGTECRRLSLVLSCLLSRSDTQAMMSAAFFSFFFTKHARACALENPKVYGFKEMAPRRLNSTFLQCIIIDRSRTQDR